MPEQVTDGIDISSDEENSDCTDEESSKALMKKAIFGESKCWCPF